MSKNKKVSKQYNDGLVFFGHYTDIRNEYKKVVGQTFNEEGSLRYSERNAREQDIMQALAQDSQLDLKIAVPMTPAFANINRDKLHCKVIGKQQDNIMYEVLQVDLNRTLDEYYITLQEVGLKNG